MRNSDVHRRLVLLLCGTLMSCVADAQDVQNGEDVQYNRDVRPILADGCFHCHGPDEAARQADLRLDMAEAVTAGREGGRIIDPGRPDHSQLLRRVLSTDPDVRMPPPDSGDALTADQIRILTRWIKAGAEYQTHWSFLPVQRPTLPAVLNADWPQNPIDRFVLARLNRAQLAPSPRADPATLIRRVTLDLTGLPPTLAEVDAFQTAAAVDFSAAWNVLVDRLLNSRRYGEHMAAGWLDAARFADTNGYFTDEDRVMWPWRDWVIAAFNQNMPFDRFTIEQLAGDLLPDATTAQQVATGFNRNHMVNNETGIIEEEFRVEYVVDRVDTTATVWLGLTVACARCHDHKFDPISQRDFYRFFAFFNNVPERGLSGSNGNAKPLLSVPTAEQTAALDTLRQQIADADKQFERVEVEIAAAQAKWETTAVAKSAPAPADNLVAHYALDEPQPHLEHSGVIAFDDGMVGRSVKLDGESFLSISDVADFEHSDAFSAGVWLSAQSAGCVLSKMDDANDMRGFDVALRKGKAEINLVHRWNRNAIRIVSAAPVPMNRWQHLLVTYDGSGKAAGVTLYLDGERQAVNVERDNLSGTIRNTQPVRLGRRQSSATLKGQLDEVRIYNAELSARAAMELAGGELIRSLVPRAANNRSSADQRRLRDWFVKHHADRRLVDAIGQRQTLRDQERRLRDAIPSTMIMRDSETPRPAFVLLRGQYDEPGEPVTAAVPAFLATDIQAPTPAAAARPQTRRDLADWLVQRDNPLTARVTVNRLWQQMFGIGLVKTVDDLGLQGEWPSHPDLLDWLAVELMEHGWDLQHVIRLIVGSAVYQQTSDATPASYAADAENRLLSRGPRFRMNAEMLRDNALAISGLLVEKIGGPSVMPYQPAGMWEDVSYDGSAAYQQATGADLYRRSLYTFWKRQSPPPTMLTFDAPTRETCTVQRSRTNTPLQALALMNDPTFVEAAKKLAERTLHEVPGNSVAERATFAFRSATARQPVPAELRVLCNLFATQKSAYEQHPQDAVQLLTVGDSACDSSLNTSELAAWTNVASLILSLDETVTRR